MPKAQSNLDPRIDLYISKAAPFARPILEHIREMVHRAWPEVVETMKWSQPFFTHANGKIIVSLGAFKQHCRVGVHHGDAAGALREAAGYERDAVGSVVRIESLKDLPPNKVLVASIRQAAESAATGKAMMRRQNQTPKPPLEVPADMAAAMRKSKSAQKTFDGFSPSHRREYVEWVTGAKQEATRERRIAQAVGMMAEGKSRHWKYTS